MAKQAGSPATMSKKSKLVSAASERFSPFRNSTTAVSERFPPFKNSTTAMSERFPPFKNSTTAVSERFSPFKKKKGGGGGGVRHTDSVCACESVILIKRGLFQTSA